MIFIKGLLGIGLLASAIYIGFANFSLWRVPVLSLFFTAAYIQGKWYLWNKLFRQQNRKLY